MLVQDWNNDRGISFKPIMNSDFCPIINYHTGQSGSLLHTNVC